MDANDLKALQDMAASQTQDMLKHSESSLRRAFVAGYKAAQEPMKNKADTAERKLHCFTNDECRKLRDNWLSGGRLSEFQQLTLLDMAIEYTSIGATIGWTLHD